MKLKSFGCSFIYGDELSDSVPGPSLLTWPSLLAKHLGRDYECYAKNGSGNLEILDTLLSHIKNDDTLYVINWTWPERYSYKKDSVWQTLQPNQNTPEATTYYKNFEDQYVDKLTLLTCIASAAQVLKDSKVQYIMTYMNDIHISPTDSETALKPLYYSILPHITHWDNHGFNAWCEINNFEKCPGRHWAESTQIQAFEYIKSQL